MFNLDKVTLEQKAVERGFNRDVLEKVYRLEDILTFISGHPILGDLLVLKGGTAINLTVFDLPRLSVDIDLDIHRECGRDEMLHLREEVSQVLERYMRASGYTLNEDRIKMPHSLDSRVFMYRNAGGNMDNIKIEINCSMRCHVLPICQKEIYTDISGTPIMIRTLDPVELFGSKIKALTERAAARDLYDVYNMLRFNTFSQEEQDMLRRCVVFYRAVGSTGGFREEISLGGIDQLNFQKVRETLLPVLQKDEKIDLEGMKREVGNYLRKLLVLKPEEKMFLHEFGNGNYVPELLFENEDIVRRIEKHPMAIWKCARIREAKEPERQRAR